HLLGAGPIYATGAHTRLVSLVAPPDRMNGCKRSLTTSCDGRSGGGRGAVCSCIAEGRTPLRVPMDGDLNLGQVVLGIPAEDHSRSFVIDLAGGQNDLVAFPANVLQDLGVGPVQLLVRPLVQQGHARSTWKLSNRDPVRGVAGPDRQARLEIGVV